jgi:two-component system phosphate regulon response regulator PhoB
MNGESPVYDDRALTLIFVVEDDRDIASLISHTLKGAGFATRVFLDGQLVVEAALEQLPALILLDVMLPGLNGIELLRCLESQQRTRSIRKIMLSARGSEMDKVQALELGADDYVTKPFSPRELVLRIRAVLRSSAGVADQHRTAQVGNLIADLDARTVTVQDREVLLSATEYNLLVHFMLHAGRTLSRDRLLEDIWPPNRPIEDSRIIDVYVRRLRERIEADPSNPRILVTQRGGDIRLSMSIGDLPTGIQWFSLAAPRSTDAGATGMDLNQRPWSRGSTFKDTDS